MTKIKDILKHCDTGLANKLTEEILKPIIASGYLVKIDHPLIICKGSQNNPYLQKQAYLALMKAVSMRNTKLIINSCLRSVVQQHILRRQYEMGICGIRAAATPGRSTHQSGLAIDIEDAKRWKPFLHTQRWRYLGDFDPMHFEYGSSIDLGRQQIIEFQKYWNRNNPKDTIAVDGIWGRVTGSKCDLCSID